MKYNQINKGVFLIWGGMNKFRVVKHLINKVYKVVLGIHDQIERDSLIESMGSFGKNSYIEFPVNSYSGISKIFIGDNTYICSGSRMNIYGVDDNDDTRIYIGNNCYICYRLSILCGIEVVIEDNVLIASDVCLVGENHGIDPVMKGEYMNQELIMGRIHIGEGTWIGEKAVILPNVIIGKKCVVGAGAVVSKSVPDYSLVVGNPAKAVKKYNFDTNEWERCK